VTISGSGNGGGFTVGYGGSNILYTSSWHYTNSCTAYQLAPYTTVCQPNPPTPPYNNGPNGAYWEWDVTSCSWILVNGASPIVIDTRNTGFKFTNPNTSDGYVSFDIRGDGTLFKVSWPQHGSGNAWLALPDQDGNVTSGKQLFGNYTYYADQLIPNYPNPNGFNALMYYDRIDQGGDGNLIIDNKDAVWPKLRLWIDEHCYQNPDQACVSRPSELHKPEEFGMTSISLVWDQGFKLDKVGNQFKFFSVMNPDAETTPVNAKGEHCCDLHQKSHDGRLAYDVFLKIKQN
jgi:hypothetical protein